MDIKKLEYFIAVVECGGYTRASKVLFVSQSTLSKAIKSLENRLGVKLFTLFGRRVQPTEQGQYLYERAKVLVDYQEKTIQSIRHASKYQLGSIKLGLPPIIGTCTAASLVAGFLKRFPRVSLHVQQSGASFAQRMTANGELDVAFVITPVSYGSLEMIPITKNKNVLIVSPDHQLAKEKVKQVSYARLRNEKFVLLNEEYTLFYSVMSGCHEAGFDPNIVLKLEHWDLVVEMVKLNAGVSIVPNAILERYKPDGICAINLKHASGEWNVAMVFQKGNTKSYAVSAFISYVLEQINYPTHIEI